MYSLLDLVKDLGVSLDPINQLAQVVAGEKFASFYRKQASLLEV